MSRVPSAMLEQAKFDAAMIQVFSHEVRPSDVVLYGEDLHWVKHPEFIVPEEGPIPFLSFDDECLYRQWALNIGREEALLEKVFKCSSAAGIVSDVNMGIGISLLSGSQTRHETRPYIAWLTRLRKMSEDRACCR